MVAPLVAVAAAGAVAQGVSAYMQWRSSEEARKANAAELERMDALFSKLQTPEFSPNDITPEEFELVAAYVPQVAPIIEEIKPTIIEETADMQKSRQYELEALDQYKQMSQGGVSPAFQAKMDLANRNAQSQANSRQQSILDQFARRGGLDSGLQLAAQLRSAGDAQDMMGQNAARAAIEAENQRLDALARGASLAGNVADRDVRMQGQNADIINSYNQRMSQNAQNMAKFNTGILNDAQRFNVNRMQDVADKNVNLANAAMQSNRDYDFKRRQTMYDNELAKTQGKVGIASQRMGQNTQAAMDRNNLYQGIGNLAAGAASQYGSYQAGQANRADDQAFRAEQAALDREAMLEAAKRRQEGGY